MNIKEKFNVKDISDLSDGDQEEGCLLNVLLEQARSYIQNFKWCKSIKNEYFGGGVGGIFIIILFDIENTASQSDDLLWVIVGDIPPAYLVTSDGLESPNKALQVYIELMFEWVEAVTKGLPVGHLIPVNVEPVPAFAEELENRLVYLKDNFVGKI